MFDPLSMRLLLWMLFFCRIAAEACELYLRHK
jgi:hypothetical protein